LNLDDTVAFVSVVRTGSFTGAAKKLGLPKGTVSRRVARLEDRLRSRLLERSTRRIALTELGRALFDRCNGAITEIADAERLARDAGDKRRATGTLRVSAPFDFARDSLAELMPEFHRRHPDVRIALSVSQRRVDLLAEGFDVAIRAGSGLDDSRLVARKLASSSLFLCATKAYLVRCGVPRSLADLEGHTCIGFGDASGATRFPFTGPDGAHELRLDAWLVANELGFLRMAALAGLGIGLLEENAVRADLAGGRLRRVLPGYAVVGGGLWAVYPSAQHLAPKVRVFVDFLAQALDLRGVRTTLARS
jgi:DNA-binding transcriptional LysR family regulator